MLDRVLEALPSGSSSWRVRCARCGWVMEGSEKDVAGLAASHYRDHQRKGIAGEIKQYRVSWWRRYSDWEKDHGDGYCQRRQPG
jgi:hypothetical protein